MMEDNLLGTFKILKAIQKDQLFAQIAHWTEMPNLSWKLFLRLYLLEMTFLYATGLNRYQGFQKNYKRPMKVGKSKSKARE